MSAATHGERRASPRHSGEPDQHCHVIDVLDQSRSEVACWDLSAGGACVVLESRYPAGARLAVEFSAPAGSTVLWAEVVHSDICCPALRDMWLTGCSFQGEVPPVELQRLRTTAAG